MIRAGLTLLIVATAAGCGSTAPEPPVPVPDRLNVLFVGNSLTFFNGMPEMVQALAQRAGVDQFSFEEVTAGGYSLEDHWNQGDALDAIDRGGWDVVVLQQGPSSPARQPGPVGGLCDQVLHQDQGRRWPARALHGLALHVALG